MTNAGRSPKADIFLDDVTVSGAHCQFIASNGRPSCAINSLNGTYKNRERVDSIELHAGDEVQGSFDLPAVDQAGLTCAQLLHVVNVGYSAQEVTS